MTTLRPSGGPLVTNKGMNTPATRYPIIDGHNDVLLRLYDSGDHSGQTFFHRNDKGHLDLPRAHEGGFAGGFFAMFVPRDPSLLKEEEPDWSGLRDEYELPLPPALDIAYAQRVTMAMMATLLRIEAASQGEVRVTRALDELEHSITTGVMAAIMHFEGADAIDPELNALEVYHRAGLRSLGIVWSRPNPFAHGVPFAFPHTPDTGRGLSEAGRDLVRECNRLGIMLDLSHINEQGFRDVAAVSKAPLVATHSNAHALCPSSRNLTDEQFEIIRASDGMAGLNFANCFLREDGGNADDVPIETMIRHIDYMVEHLGIDRVGFGSDFDGADIPHDIGDATGLTALIDELYAHGYSDSDLRKLTHQNWLRVLRKTWR